MRYLFTLILICMLFQSPVEAITRDAIMDTAIAYKNHNWTMNRRNMIDACCFPTWANTYFAENAHVEGVAYCWGGGHTIAQFDSAIAGNGKAGNVCTWGDGNHEGYIANTYGVDCSGFITRVWDRSEFHLGTGQLPGISTVIPQEIMKEGDIFNRVGCHVALFYYRDNSDQHNPWVIEACDDDTDGKVSMRTRSWEDYANYSKRRYNEIDDYDLRLVSPINVTPDPLGTDCPIAANASIKNYGDVAWNGTIYLGLYNQNGDLIKNIDPQENQTIPAGQTATFVFNDFITQDIGEYELRLGYQTGGLGFPTLVLLAPDNPHGYYSNPIDVEIVALPDLEFFYTAQIEPGDEPSHQGDTFTVYYTLENEGEVTAGASTTAFYYSSNNDYLDDDDIPFVYPETEEQVLQIVPPIGAGELINMEQDLTFTMPIEQGTSYILVVADIFDEVNECTDIFQTFNISAIELNISGEPDLITWIPEQGVLVASPAHYIDIPFRVQNIGGGSTETQFWCSLYLSEDEILSVSENPQDDGDWILDSRILPILEANEIDSSCIYHALIPYYINLGDYYLISRVDTGANPPEWQGNGEIPETNEDNNNSDAYPISIVAWRNFSSKWDENYNKYSSSVFAKKEGIHQNYPNPFNPTTTIAFTIPKNLQVYLGIYDMTGKLIKTLIDAPIEAGYHTVMWDGTDDNGRSVSSGVYFYKLKSKGYEETKKMLLLK